MFVRVVRAERVLAATVRRSHALTAQATPRQVLGLGISWRSPPSSPHRARGCRWPPSIGHPLARRGPALALAMATVRARRRGGVTAMVTAMALGKTTGTGTGSRKGTVRSGAGTGEGEGIVACKKSRHRESWGAARGSVRHSNPCGCQRTPFPLHPTTLARALRPRWASHVFF